jgi:prepilin-type N-terminal cleavage/methylation domain-containing protein
MLRERIRNKEQGFTLIEMAIVLVVIGLILGMVYKGRQLIASAKVKNTNAAYNKVIAGMNTFYDRYGFYPGDGCIVAEPANPNDCKDNSGNPQDGLIGYDSDGGATDTTENAAFWYLLTDETNILSEADTKSAVGSEWNATGNATSSWIYANGADLRIVCDLDRTADDGNSQTGDILAVDSTISGATSGASLYDSSTDCWDQTGIAAVELKILP